MFFDFTTYSRQFRLLALQNNLSNDEIDDLLLYVKRLVDKNLPIIFDQEHLSRLMGLDYLYLLSVSNSKDSHYKQYQIPKRSGGFRTIMEPLPSLKQAQSWILNNILYANETFYSPVAKAFIKKNRVKR